MNTFGCTPAAYRKNPVSIALSNLKVVFFPEHYINRGGIVLDYHWKEWLFVGSSFKFKSKKIILILLEIKR